MSLLASAVRYAWVAPASLVGLAVAAPALLAGARPRVVAGAVEVCGGRLGRWIGRLPEGLRFGAMTLGHVIVGVDRAALERARVHEHVHVRQYERWGVLFFPLYLASSLWQWACGRDPYWDNRFEREAYARDGSGRRGPC